MEFLIVYSHLDIQSLADVDEVWVIEIVWVWFDLIIKMLPTISISRESSVQMCQLAEI